MRNNEKWIVYKNMEHKKNHEVSKIEPPSIIAKGKYSLVGTFGQD